MSLNAPVPDGTLGFIDGQFALSGSTGTTMVEDPATGETIAALGVSDAEVVDMAISSCSTAMQGSWGKLAPSRKARILADCATAIRDRTEDLARIETLDTGKPLSQAREDVQGGARYFEFYAGVADKLHGESIPSVQDAVAYTVREPFGVVAHITPWNSPFSQMARGVAPSLAAGNTVVVKPSELTPLSTLLLASTLSEAGLPDGACNVVNGPGEGTGSLVVKHPNVRKVTFTGSTETGRIVMQMAAERIVPCSLELGGKSPTIVFEDADLIAAAEAAVGAVVRNSGQSCSATTRILVQRSVYDEFLRLCHARMADLSLGHGLDDPDLGPLVSAGHKNRVLDYIEHGIEEGAKLVFGADFSRPRLEPRLAGGHFVGPVLFADVSPHMAISRDEIFGPVQCVLEFDGEDEAVELANDTEFGLMAGIFTSDLTRALRLAQRLQAGQVNVNRYPIGGVEAPFGGYKQSGIGREKGLEALADYTQIKAVLLNTRQAEPANG